MSTEIDLRQLAVDRPPVRSPRPRRRPIVSRYVIPGIVVFGFVALLGWALRDRFARAKSVTVIPVMVARVETQQAGAPLFQAAGWVEPRPTSVLVPAFTEGIVSELLVVENQSVEKGQVIARLVDADARLAVEQASADHSLRAAEVEGARAELLACRMRRDKPVHLQASLSEAQSLLAKIETELARMPHLRQGAEARYQFAEQNLKAKQAAGAALAARVVQEAQSELTRAAAEMNELRERQPKLEAELLALTQRRDALASQAELRIDEHRQVSAAEAQLKMAIARERQAQLTLQSAQLRLDRTEIVAPSAGSVLALVARPGARVMGLDPNGEHKASTVVTLYDPKMLQVRADVRLEDVPLIQPGQPATLQTASAKGSLEGKVLFATSQANVQKNTLEVKIAILDPPATIRPEMLVAATFLAPEGSKDDQRREAQRERLLIPRQLVDSSGDASAVWTADATGRARRVQLRLGTAQSGELVDVLDGLSPTDRVISTGRESLQEGDRIAIASEDAAIGVKTGS